MSDDTLYAFMSSAPGSGSTAWIEGINEHPDIVAYSELIAWGLGDHGVAPGMWHQPDAVIAERLRPAKLPPEAQVELRALTEPRAAGRLLRTHTPGKSRARCIMDKHPSRSGQLPFLAARNPDLKLIWLHRDWRDVVTSMIRKVRVGKLPQLYAEDGTTRPTRLGYNWGPPLAPAHLDQQVEVRCAMMAALSRAGYEATLRAGVEVLEVDFESWRADPRGEYNRVYEYLGLPRLDASAPAAIEPAPSRKLGNWEREISPEWRVILTAVYEWAVQGFPGVGRSRAQLAGQFGAAVVDIELPDVELPDPPDLAELLARHRAQSAGA